MAESPMELVLSKLPTAKPNGNGWLACCPAHEDRSPSLSINQGDDGRVLLNCFARCSHAAIVGAMGLETKDLFVPRESRNGKPHTNGKATSKPSSKSKGTRYATAGAAVSSLTTKLGKPAGQWTDHDASGKPVALVLRFNGNDGSKEFRPVSLHEDGGWYIKAPPTPRPLYGLPDLALASVIYECEGEKAADAARSIGLVATTSLGGSQAPELTDWTPLVGKTVVILPDHDEAGRKYSEAIAGILHRLDGSTTIKIVELPGLPPKGDVVEWIEAHGDAAEPETMRQELERLVDEVAPIEPEPTESQFAEPLIDRFEPFPVDALPEPVRSFVIAGAKSIGCDPCYLAAFVLAVLASAIGNSRCLRLKRGWTVPAILWLAIIGESGSSKSPAYKLAKGLIDKRHERSIREYKQAVKDHEQALLQYEKQRDAWKKSKGDGEPPETPVPPVPKRYMVNDATAEALAPILAENPRGVLDAFDELRGWLGSFDQYRSGKGADVARWLSMYNGEGFTIDRKTGFPRTIFVRRNAVSIMGGIQPGILRIALSKENRAAGLAARLLVVHPPRKSKRWTEAVIDGAVETSMTAVVDRLYELSMIEDEEGELLPLVINPTDEAKQQFIAYYNAHNEEQSELDGDLAAAWSKLEEVAARLALIIHYCREVSDEPGLPRPVAVDAESMRRAIALTEWFKREARRVYAMLDETDGDLQRRKLVEWIERHDGSTTARELQMGPRQFRASIEAAEAALVDLVKEKFGHWEPIPTTAVSHP